MRPAIACSLLLLLGCAPSVTRAGSPNPSADEATIRALEERNRVAALNRDYQALEEIWSEHLIVNNPANRIAPNRAAVIEIFRQGIAHYSSFEATIEEIRVDGDIAVVMGAETVKPIGNAPLAGQTVQRRFTNVWKYENGRWRLWARHASVVPPRP